jgi:hypothetical protein
MKFNQLFATVLAPTLGTVLGATAIAVTALPSQAATVKTTTTNNNGTGIINPAAYRIEDLAVNGSNYNVSFKFGAFDTVYAGNPNPFSGSFADALGASILAALSGQASQVIADVPGFTSGTFTTFFIPKSPIGTNPGQDTFLECFTANGSGCSARDRSDSQRASDGVMYATFAPAAAAPGGGTNIPTPALIPGLLGMGFTAWRKKRVTAP